MTLLVAKGLAKSFGGVVAAHNVSFEVARGELVAMIGPNGAGKTTTFNMIGGQLRPDAGTMTLDGRDITGRPPREIWAAGAGRTFQVAQTFHSMTVAENVQMALISHAGHIWSLRGRAHDHQRERARELVALVGMDAAFESPISALAYGDIKRVEIAVALAGAPKLLLMDEPTAGMAPGERAHLMRLVAGLARSQQIGVLFTEHDMDAVFGHADRIVVLVRGEIIARGSPTEVRADGEVKRLYLGELGLNAADLAARAKAPQTDAGTLHTGDHT